MAEVPFSMPVANGNSAILKYSRFLPALKSGIFQNRGIPVFDAGSKREFHHFENFPFATGFENGNFSKWRNSGFQSR
jgi:hypothetical protein